MSVKAMIRNKLCRLPMQTGALYHEKITLTSEAESDIYLLPYARVYSISLNVQGDGGISFSNDSPDDLESGSGIFEAWDGVSSVNLGIVAFKVLRTSGTVIATISVKTDTH